VRERESERRGREEAVEKLRGEGGRDRFRVFFFSFYTRVGWIGAGRVPDKKILIPKNRPDPTGFSEFQPEPVKISIKSTQIGVGRIGRILPTPSSKLT
jgi:hypothetical protein